jgi:hypothetical protein
LGFGENAEGELTAQLGCHGGIRKGLENTFDTTGGGLASSEVKIRSTPLTGITKKLKNVDIVHG